MKTRTFLRTLLAAASTAALLAHAPLALAGGQTTLKVGVTAGPHAEIMEQVKKQAAAQGLDIQVVEFSDYVQPNAALASGDLQANSYQHQPYLDQQVADRGYKIVSVAKTVAFPMGVYSKKHASLKDLPEGARIGIPNDPSNGGRTLLLLEGQGLIKLKPGAGLRASPLDVVENPKKFKFVELDAAQLARSLADLDAASVPTNYALPAGLDPKKQALALEKADTPYTGVLAVREQDKNQPWVQVLIKSYQSAPVRDFINEHFKGALLPAF